MLQRAALRCWFMIGFLGLLVSVVAGCSRVWEARGPEPSQEAPEAAGVAPSSVAASPMPTATASPPLAASVNGWPVFLADYLQQLAKARAELAARGVVTTTTNSENGLSVVEQQVLDGMIDLVLAEQAAGELGLLPSPAEVRAQVQADIAAGGGEAAFGVWLKSTGQTEDEYLQAVRSSLILQRVALAVSADAAPGTQATEAESGARSFEFWLVDRREEAVIELWVGR